MIDGIRSGVVKRVLDMLTKLAKDDAEKYTKFWQAFGKVMKEGVGEDFANKDKIAKLLRFATTEKDIEDQLVQVFRATDGMALVHASGQNIDRVVTIFKASKRTGRRLIIDLYTAAILEATENINLPQSSWPEIALYVPQAQRVQIKERAWFDLLKRHSANRIFIENLQETPNRSTLLFRPLHRPDLEKGQSLSGAIYVHSQWKGYWEQGSYSMVKTWLDRHDIPKIDIHTSGHASPEALKNLVSAVKPKSVVPIHSFFPEQYPELFPNVNPHKDGEWWEV